MRLMPRSTALRIVRIDSASSVPPHIQPPIAQVPKAIRVGLRFVPGMAIVSSASAMSDHQCQVEKPLGANASCANMISTAITRLLPLPNSPSGSASVDVNTETGYKFIEGSRECGTDVPDQRIARTTLPLA